MGVSFVIARLWELSKRWWWVLLVVVLIAGIVGCGGSPIPTPVPSPIPTLPLRAVTTPPFATMQASPTEPALGEDTLITVGDNYYYPEVITVTVGTTVQWVHGGQMDHNVMALDFSWGVPYFHAGGEFTEKFSKVGVYEYGCTLHLPGMRGKIVVIQ